VAQVYLSGCASGRTERSSRGAGDCFAHGSLGGWTLRDRPSSPQGALWDALELVVLLVILCAAGLILWFWEQFGLWWEVKAAAYLMALVGLLGLFLLSIPHILRLFRKARREWRQTFPRRIGRRQP